MDPKKISLPKQSKIKLKMQNLKINPIQNISNTYSSSPLIKKTKPKKLIGTWMKNK